MPRYYRHGRCRHYIFIKHIPGNATWCFAHDTETKRQTPRRPKKLKFQSFRIKAILIKFRLSRCSAQRIRTRKKNIKCGFNKTAIDRLLQRIRRVRAAAFCSREFFLLHDNSSAHKVASSNHVLPTLISRFSISARLYSVPKIENSVKITPLCGCC